MPAAILIPPGGGEVIGDAPDRRVEILSDDDSVHATASRFAAGRAGADLHVHRRHTDLFYVLEGELTVMLGPDGDEARVPAGALARVPPLVVHGFRNAGDADVRYLNLHAPGVAFADYLRAMRDGRAFTYDQEDPPADGGRPVSEAVIGAPADGDEAVIHADVEAIRITEGPGAVAPARADGVVSLYVLEGEVVLTADGAEHRAGAGTWAQVRPGTEHAVSAPGAARMLLVQTPAP